MKTVIVTGAAGFIGSTLVGSLLKNKFRVIGIDNFTNFYAKKIKQKNISDYKKNKNFIFLQKNILNTNLSLLLKKSDYLFHLAAQPGVRSSWGKQFSNYVENNILVTQKILEEAKSVNSLKKIVIASSSSVYGRNNGKMNETKTSLTPHSPYGVSKLTTEKLADVYVNNFSLPITTLRYFTVYGPRQRPDMSFMNFMVKSLQKKSITIFGNGKQKRDFTYVDDIVNATLSCLKLKESGNILNIGGGSVVSINKIISIIQKFSNSEMKISYKDFPDGDVLRTESDISKARKLIDYKPKTSIKDGIEKQFEYVKKYHKMYKN